MAGTPSVSKNNDPWNDDPLDRAIAEFLRAEAAGNSGSREEWLTRYPECASALSQFFDDREQVDQLLLPIRENVPAGKPAAVQGVGRNDVTAQETVDVTLTPPHFLGERYRTVRFHAHGGMGEIWLARDERIGRQVAVKRLRPGRDGEQARFQIEAQVTGQLEHPGVVPLHDLGFDVEGQPYYVMKFVQGHSLRESIADYHAHKSAAGWPRDLEFLRLLESFVSVCNAVAYAHSKGVLHRDIKPDNVMLGAFGETLLLDWGLAKSVGQPEMAASSRVRVSPGTSTATQDGAIVGSPPYMSPEGAEGHADNMDQRSDVYLLGATLYEILTGRPPRHGSSRWDIIDQARRSPPAPPRAIDRQVPKALEAICLKSMAFHKRDRYASPIALAEDVQRYLAGETVTAYRETASERLWRWVLRRRRALLRSAVAALILMLGIAAAWSYSSANQFAVREQARRDLADFYRHAEECQFLAASSDPLVERAPYYDPQRALRTGRKALVIADQWGERGERLPLTEERDDLRRTRFNLILLMALTTGQSSDTSDSNRDAVELIERAERIEGPTVGSTALRKRLVVRLGKSGAPHEEQRTTTNLGLASITTDDHFLRGELLRLAAVRPSDSSAEPTATISSRNDVEEAIREYRSALKLNPRHFWARFRLGRCLLALDQNQDAIEVLSGCVALRPDSPWSLSARGLAYALKGQQQEAMDDLERALSLDPDFRPAQLNRGVAHWLDGDLDRALNDFDRVLEPPDEQRLVEARFYRGQIYLQPSHLNLDQARAEFSAVIQRLPDFRAYWFRSQTHFLLNEVERGRSDIARYVSLKSGASGQAAELEIGKALRELAVQLPGAAHDAALGEAKNALTDWRVTHPNDAEALQHLGGVQDELGQREEAIKTYSLGLNHDSHGEQLLNMRGWAYVNQEQLDLARADFVKIIGRSPNNPAAHAGLGYVCALEGRSAAAREDAAIALLNGSNNYLILHQIACIY